MNNKLIAVIGPTATGKTRLAVQLAAKFNGEIISADSRQVYKGMDIGTGKDLSEYITDSGNINYYLINVADHSEEFNLFSYKQKFLEAYHSIRESGKLPFLAGGTGMYISAIIQDYKLTRSDLTDEDYSDLHELSDEELKEKLMLLKPLHNTTDLISRERLIKAIASVSGSDELSYKFNSCVIGVHFERDEIKKRITARLKQRLESGMIEEVKELMNKGLSIEKLLFFGLEYKYIGLYLNGDLNYNDMYQKLNSSIHSFAKRQMTWFRKMEKEGVNINWVDRGDYQSSVKIIDEYLQNG